MFSDVSVTLACFKTTTTPAGPPLPEWAQNYFNAEIPMNIYLTVIHASQRIKPTDVINYI